MIEAMEAFLFPKDEGYSADDEIADILGIDRSEIRKIKARFADRIQRQAAFSRALAGRDITQKGYGATPGEPTGNVQSDSTPTALNPNETNVLGVDSQLSSEIGLPVSLESIYARLRGIGAMKHTMGDELGLWGRLAEFVIMSKEPDLSLSLKCNLLMFGKSAVSYERAGSPDATKEEQPDYDGGVEHLREMQAGLERDRAELARREEEHRAAVAGLAAREKEFERQMAEVQDLQSPMGKRKKGSRRKTG
jgi:hypothetical protein